MSTLIGAAASDNTAKVGEPSHPWSDRGYQVKPTIDRGPNDSGCPFETKKPIPYNVIEGGGYISGKDGPKWPERTYQVDQAALDMIRKRNAVPGGFATDETVNGDKLAELHAAKQVKQAAQAVVPAVSPAPQRPPLPAVTAEPAAAVCIGYQAQEAAVLKQVAENPPPEIPRDEAGNSPVQIDYRCRVGQQTKPARTAVRFAGRFGRLQAPYDQVFVDGITLVLVQHSTDGVYYEPPYDPEEPMEISYNQCRYLCHSGLHYKMPNECSAHTVYLIERDLNVQEAQ
jgi:hypothetical protein